MTIPAGTITLDPNLTTLMIDSNMSFIGFLASTDEGPGPGTTVERNVSTAAFRLFQISDDMTVSFFNMTLQGGQDENGGAILLGQDATLNVSTCDLINNTASLAGPGPYYGGAIYANSGSSVSIDHSMLGLNKADNGGGAIAAIGATSVTISDSSITGNEVTVDGNGGGLFISNTFGTSITNTNIIGNVAKKNQATTGRGGGVYIYTDAYPSSDPVFYMSGGQLNGNSADGDGGGIYLRLQDSSPAAVLDGVSVTDNEAGGKGGGAYIFQGELAGSLTALTGNTATGGIPGIAFKANQASAPITVPANQQTVQQD